MLDNVAQAVFVERTHCINCSSAHLTELSHGSYTEQPLLGFLTADPTGEDPMPFLQRAMWSLVRCDDCQQVFHRHILNEEWNERRFTEWMSADAIKKFEDSLGPKSQRQFQTAISHVEHILRLDRLTHDLRSGAALRLLDFGCGFGSFLETSIRFGFDAVGVDRSIGRRKEATILILPSLDGVDGQFHAITMFEVLEHLDDPLSVLKSLLPKLLPGGVLIIETPDCTGVTDIKSHDDYRAAHPLEHINCFTNDTMKSIAARAGFQHINRGIVSVSADGARIVKRLGKHALRRDDRSTRLYFRRPAENQR